MPTKESTHIFFEGMDMDTDKSIKSPKTYDRAENLRLIANEGTSSGPLYNIKGSQLLQTLGGNGSNLRIVASCNIGDYVIILWHNGTGGSSYIDRYDYNSETGVISNRVSLYVDSTDSLGFIDKGVADIVVKYESSSLIKIYWAVEDQPIRMGNITEYFTDTGGVGGTFLDPDRLNIITNIEISSPEFNAITSGSLRTGKVQYAYNLYKKNGQESLISPLSKLIPLFASNDSYPLYRIGDSENINTSKGVSLNVSITSDDCTFYDYLRLYRTHYAAYGEEPTITIVGDFNINNSDVNIIIDSGGEGLGAYSLEEFSLLDKTFFTAKTIESKDNRLFAANVEEEFFDISSVDFRAYRFNAEYSGTHTGSDDVNVLADSTASWVTAELIGRTIHNTTDGSSGNIYYNTSNTITTILAGGSENDWDTGDAYIIYNESKIYQDYDGNGLTTVTDLNWGWVDDEHSCVNLDNTGTTAPTFVFQEDGTTIGGEGPNLYFTFSNDSNILDSVTTSYDTYSGASSTSFNDMGVLTSNVTYQRNEVYRIGLVFFNNKGQKTPVKWMCDVKFPGPSDPGIKTGTLERIASHAILEENSYYYTLSIEVSLKPELTFVIGGEEGSGTYTANTLTYLQQRGVVSWQLVRALRRDEDKSIIASGMLSPALDVSYSIGIGIDNQTVKKGLPFFSSYGTGYYAANNDRILTFYSPDMFYSNNRIKSGDSVILSGKYPEVIEHNYADYSASPCDAIGKYPKLTIYGKTLPPTHKIVRVIDEVWFIDNENNPTVTVNMDDAVNGEYNHVSTYSHYNDPTGSSSYHGGEAGTSYVFHMEDDFDPNDGLTRFSGYEGAYAYIYRDAINRYGGYTKAARENTEYVPCGNIESLEDTTIEGYGGDTYISYFAYSNTIYASTINGSHTDMEMANVIAFPVESQINCDLTHDQHYFRLKAGDKFLIREIDPEEEILTDEPYSLIMQGDLYKYNTVYSQEQSVGLNYDIDTDDLITDFPVRVLYSDLSISGENIDSWTSFRSGNYLDLDYKFSQINIITKWNNIVYFFQDRAFGFLPISQKTLLQNTNLESLQIGVSGILDYYSYISENQGAKNLTDVIIGGRGLYWYDSLDRSIIRYSNKTVEDLTISKKINSYIKGLDLDEIGVLGYDKKYNEILFSLGSEVLVFNEVSDFFTGFYMYTSNYFISIDSNLYYTSASVCGTYLYLYKTGTTTAYNTFIVIEGTAYITPSVLIISDNSEFNRTKVYDSISFYTEVINSSGYMVNTETIDYIEFWNDYQYTGSTQLILATNLERDEREFKTYIPRNIVDSNGTEMLDIFSVGNHDDTRLFRERMRDKYITTKLTYSGSNSITIPYINYKYRTSIR